MSLKVRFGNLSAIAFGFALLLVPIVAGAPSSAYADELPPPAVAEPVAEAPVTEAPAEQSVAEAPVAEAPAEQTVADRHVDDGACSLDDVALSDDLVVTEHDNTHVVRLQVQSHSLQNID